MSRAALAFDKAPSGPRDRKMFRSHDECFRYGVLTLGVLTLGALTLNVQSGSGLAHRSVKKMSAACERPAK